MALQITHDLGGEARITAIASAETRAAGENGPPSLAHGSEITTMDILVSKAGRRGIASVNRLDEETVREAIDFALSLARLSLPDEIPVLASPDIARPARPLDFLFDPMLAISGFDELQDILVAAVSVIDEDPRTRLERYEATVSVLFRGVWNSLGVSQAERRTLSQWSFLGMASDGDDVTGRDYRTNSSFRHAGLRQMCLDDAAAFRCGVLRGLNPRQAPSYTGPVLLAPRAVHDLIAASIVAQASGREIVLGRSRWADALGARVAHPMLTVVERPHDPRFAAATAFDGDGVPTLDTSILDQGVLIAHLHDVSTSSRLHARTTGHSDRTLCLEMSEGNTALDDMVAAFPTIVAVERFSGNIDPIGGCYSGIAKSSRLYRHGEDCGCIAETMIAGDLNNLTGSVLAVSQETICDSGEFVAPFVLLDGVCVTGS